MSNMDIFNERRQELRERRRHWLEALAKITSTVEGQRVLGEVLTRLAVGRPLADASEIPLYNAGMRLYADMSEAAPHDALFIYSQITEGSL